MTAGEAAIEAKRRPPEEVLGHIAVGGDVIVGLGNGEPKTVIDAIEANADRLEEVRLHQMLPLRDRPYIEGEVKGLRHVSWFLSPHDKAAFHRGGCDLVPNNFSEVPALMRRTAREPIVLAAASSPDPHGYFSLGCHAEYVASMIGEMPFFLEVNAQMPRTFGENQIHVSQILGWCEADYPLVELPPREGRGPTAASPSWSPSGFPTRRRSRPGSAPCRTWCSRCWPTTETLVSTPSCSPPASSTWSRRVP
jgi:hypothetical protein